MTAARGRRIDRRFRLFAERFTARQHVTHGLDEIGGERDDIGLAIVPNAGPGKRMARRDQNERLPQHGPTTTILGRTVHEARHGRHQNQESGNEGGGGIAGRVLWDTLWKI